MDETSAGAPHTLYLENRAKAVFTGVSDVRAFNEENVQLVTARGALSLSGEGLQVTQLNLETGDVTVEGQIDALSYSAPPKKSAGLFGRVFG